MSRSKKRAPIRLSVSEQGARGMAWRRLPLGCAADTREPPRATMTAPDDDDGRSRPVADVDAATALTTARCVRLVNVHQSRRFKYII